MKTASPHIALIELSLLPFQDDGEISPDFFLRIQPSNATLGLTSSPGSFVIYVSSLVAENAATERAEDLPTPDLFISTSNNEGIHSTYFISEISKVGISSHLVVGLALIALIAGKMILHYPFDRGKYAQSDYCKDNDAAENYCDYELVNLCKLGQENCARKIGTTILISILSTALIMTLTKEMNIAEMIFWYSSMCLLARYCDYQMYKIILLISLWRAR